MAVYAAWVGELVPRTVGGAALKRGQVNKEENVMVVDSAKGDYFDAFYKKPKTGGEEKAEESLLNPLFDGSASWFT